MRAIIFVTSLAIGMNLASPASAQVSIGVNLPGVSIGINLPVYPSFVPVPGYPVYYAPQVDANLFFYDGLYWVYVDDNWYSSSWYNGPWELVEPNLVPYFVLRIPIIYYRRPPGYFGQWDRRQPPRWGEHWGAGWQQQHRDWDRWDRARPPARAPLPVYQRQYSRDRYPDPNEQQALQQRHYRYHPREAVDRRLLSAPHQQPRRPRQEEPKPRAAQPPRQRARPQPQPAQPPRQQARPQPQRAQQPRQQARPQPRVPKRQEQKADGREKSGNEAQRPHSGGPPN